MNQVRTAAPSSVLTVAELARRGGVSVSAIHFWERQGLIEGWRTAGNQRRYHRATLRRIAIIKVAQAVGIPLSDIKARLLAMPSGKNGWVALADDWRSDLDRRIALLTQIRDQLETCIGCGCLSVSDCPLRNPEDRLAEEESGPLHMMQAAVAR
ncbi:redox-sensitive transcriptional activator SoxR [Sphingomonas endophytica]|uniref:redox-sensitive transcriptional activator SoxR n=1 Tax=Sphingomonas endophytica TaxID=869719 RepID=UPI0009FA5C1C|nr:redox-sensitive transcriptional activator SoxR [Sphingomonas endophytica]